MTVSAKLPSSPSRRPSVGRLADRLNSYASIDADYWSFAEKDDRDFVHSIFHYPAMMVPRLQRELMQTCVNWDKAIKTVYDPFAGSGTVMTEAMLLGLDFYGTDINPLAALVCRAKAEYFDADRLEADLRRVLRDAARDRHSKVTVSFPNRDKWFAPHVAGGLSKLYRAISARPGSAMRRFWWVAVAETVRLTSNSRTSTVKLHIRPHSELSNRPDPISVFAEVAARNVQVLREQQQLLEERQLLSGNTYCGRVNLAVADVRVPRSDVLADIMVTSPPYGDNHTTVPYGQASYLPLQWIDRRDIAPGVGDECVASTHFTDTASLGGSRKIRPAEIDSLLDRSLHLRRTLERLATERRDRRLRVASFYRDVDASLEPILRHLRPGGIMIWTVGERSVGGQTIPMAQILRELLGRRASLVAHLDRSIPQARKRMASRNSTTSTMGSETILVMQKRLAR
jgi:hypothetical protein